MSGRSTGGRSAATVGGVEFLESLDSPPAKFLKPDGYSGPVEGEWRWNGPGQLGLEVVQGRSSARPNVTELRDLWRAREAKKGFPLLLVVLYPKGGVTVAATCGPTGEDPVVRHDLDPATVERLCAAALAQPDRLSALRFLAAHEVEEQSQLPGVRNLGLFATNELEHGAPRRADWNEAVAAGRALTGAGNHDLLSELGYRVEANSLTTNVLVTNDRQRAVAVILGEGEDFETPTNHFESVSAVQHGLAAADRLELDWLVLVRGRTLRLYSSKPDVGVGRRGRSATYLEINLDLISEEQLGLVTLCFGAGALTEGGTVAALLESSSEFVAGLGERLRDRVYFDAVPGLATVIAERHGDLTPEGLSEAYTQAMTVLFRLLFVAYGEDKDLLPYRSNGAYAEHSITRLAKTLTEMRIDGTPFDPHGTDLWDDVQALWTAIDKGRENWAVPAYGGALFSTDPAISSSGAALANYRLTNEEIGPTLSALLVDESLDGLIGPVDFRSLSVREFGTIYEGLLESELSVAPYNLTYGEKKAMVRAERGDDVVVSEGDVWFHNRSGERKSTGSYFTKPFAVEHLLQSALRPALDSHLEQVKALLDSGDEAGAARRLFEFRCADIAMGSAHFLIAAVDHIEAAFSRFLTEHPIPRVNAELLALRQTALDQLGELSGRYEIDPAQVLRRLIARRCIYGVDLNAVAVELARLGLWIHTFVPGLPLGFLDRNLICGNSLSGFTGLDEAYAFLGEGTLFKSLIQDGLNESQAALERLANLNDATIADIEEARKASQFATDALEPVKRFLDLLALQRASLTGIDCSILGGIEDASPHWERPEHQQLVSELKILHFPLLFPEVFQGPRPGFSCILGNPPWEEATIERLGFFSTKLPGIKSLTGPQQREAIQRAIDTDPSLEQEYERRADRAALMRKVLLAKQRTDKKEQVFPGMGSGDPDVYKAFGWQFWRLLAHDGVLGVVLPRSALSANGGAHWRKRLLSEGDIIEVLQLVNNRQWVFAEVHPQYTIAMLSARRTGEPDDEVLVRGPYSSMEAYLNGLLEPPGVLPSDGLLAWTKSCSFPLIPTQSAVSTFMKMRKHPDIGDDEGRQVSIRPVGEFHGSNDKLEKNPNGFFSDDLAAAPTNSIPVIGGRGFNHWQPETGEHYGWADPKVALRELQRRREDGEGRSNSVWFGRDSSWLNDPETLPALHPRIAFRDVTNRTNSRTVIPALVPPNYALTNKAPYLLLSETSPRHEALVLGCLSSVILDWYARRTIELNVNFYLFNAFPLPILDLDRELEQRIVTVAGRLAAIDDRYDDWAAEVGVPVGSVQSEGEKAELVAELDAVVAHLYGLDVSDLETIWDTFHTTVDHLPDLEKVVGYFEEWSR